MTTLYFSTKCYHYLLALTDNDLVTLLYFSTKCNTCIYLRVLTQIIWLSDTSLFQHKMPSLFACFNPLWLSDTIQPLRINSLGPSDTIWRWGSWSTLVQLMACCLTVTAPSHYLNQCWLIISKVPWHSYEDIIIRRFEDTNQQCSILTVARWPMLWKIPVGYETLKSCSPHGHWNFSVFLISLKYI